MTLTASFAATYEVYNAGDWNALSSVTFTSNDVVNVNADFTAASSLGSVAHPFVGTINGNFHTITANTPLIGYANGATIRQLTVTGEMSVADNGSYGTIVANTAAGSALTIDQCLSTSAVQLNSGAVTPNVGGLVGATNGSLTISNSGFYGSIKVVDASLSETAIIGGLVGLTAADPSISSSYVYLNSESDDFEATTTKGTFAGSNNTSAFPSCFYLKPLGRTQDGVAASADAFRNGEVTWGLQKKSGKTTTVWNQDVTGSHANFPIPGTDQALGLYKVSYVFAADATHAVQAADYVNKADANAYVSRIAGGTGDLPTAEKLHVRSASGFFYDDINGENVEFTKNSYIYEDLTVTINTVDLYQILRKKSFSGGVWNQITANGETYTNPTSAQVITAFYGSTVNVTVTPEAGYSLKTITVDIQRDDENKVGSVTDISLQTDPVTNITTGASFKMPELNAFVTPEFEIAQPSNLTARPEKMIAPSNVNLEWNNPFASTESGARIIIRRVDESNPTDTLLVYNQPDQKITAWSDPDVAEGEYSYFLHMRFDDQNTDTLSARVMVGSVIMSTLDQVIDFEAEGIDTEIKVYDNGGNYADYSTNYASSLKLIPAPGTRLIISGTYDIHGNATAGDRLQFTGSGLTRNGAPVTTPAYTDRFKTGYVIYGGTGSITDVEKLTTERDSSITIYFRSNPTDVASGYALTVSVDSIDYRVDTCTVNAFGSITEVNGADPVPAQDYFLTKYGHTVNFKVTPVQGYHVDSVFFGSRQFSAVNDFGGRIDSTEEMEFSIDDVVSDTGFCVKFDINKYYVIPDTIGEGHGDIIVYSPKDVIPGDTAYAHINIIEGQGDSVFVQYQQKVRVVARADYGYHWAYWRNGDVNVKPYGERTADSVVAYTTITPSLLEDSVVIVSDTVFAAAFEKNKYPFQINYRFSNTLGEITATDDEARIAVNGVDSLVSKVDSLFHFDRYVITATPPAGFHLDSVFTYRIGHADMNEIDLSSKNILKTKTAEVQLDPMDISLIGDTAVLLIFAPNISNIAPRAILAKDTAQLSGVSGYDNLIAVTAFQSDDSVSVHMAAFMDSIASNRFSAPKDILQACTGERIIAAAEAREGYNFTGWWDGGTLIDALPAATPSQVRNARRIPDVTNAFSINGDSVLIAVFDINKYEVKADTAFGTRNGEGIEMGAVQKDWTATFPNDTVDYNTHVTITAVPAEGYHVSGLFINGADSTATSLGGFYDKPSVTQTYVRSFNVTADSVFVFTFEKNHYEADAQIYTLVDNIPQRSNAGGDVTFAINGINAAFDADFFSRNVIDYEDDALLTATPALGYHVAKIAKRSAPDVNLITPNVGKSEVRSYQWDDIKVTDTIDVFFSVNEYSVHAEAATPDGNVALVELKPLSTDTVGETLTAFGAGADLSVPHGKGVRIYADPLPGYHLTKWVFADGTPYENEVTLPTVDVANSNRDSIDIDSRSLLSDTSVVAYFEINKYNVKATAERLAADIEASGKVQLTVNGISTPDDETVSVSDVEDNAELQLLITPATGRHIKTIVRIDTVNGVPSAPVVLQDVAEDTHNSVPKTITEPAVNSAAYIVTFEPNGVNFTLLNGAPDKDSIRIGTRPLSTVSRLDTVPEYGKNVGIYAKPSVGRSFIGFQRQDGTIEPSDATTLIDGAYYKDVRNIQNDTVITALFSDCTYDFTINAVGRAKVKYTLSYQGTVYDQGLSDEGGSLTVSAHHGDVITIDSEADDCQQFQNWSNGNAEGAFTVNVDADAYADPATVKNFTVTYATVEKALNLSKARVAPNQFSRLAAVLSVDGVTSTGDNNNDLTCGDSYQISATEYTTSGDRFIGWAPMNTSGNYSPADVTIADPTTTIDLTEDVSLVALYEPITYSVTVQVNPGMETYGDVSVDNAQFANSVNVQALQGQTINLYNTAEEGHSFTSWLLCTTPTTYVVNSNDATNGSIIVTAMYDNLPYTMTTGVVPALADGLEKGTSRLTVNGVAATSAFVGNTVVWNAVPTDPAYEFAYWSTDPAGTVKVDTLPDPVATKILRGNDLHDWTLYANFSIKQIRVVGKPAVATREGVVTVLDRSGADKNNQDVDYGSNLTVSATAGEGYDFIGWTGGLDDNAPTVSKTFVESANYNAIFQVRQLTMTAGSSVGGKTVIVNASYDSVKRVDTAYWTPVEYVAVPQPGWKLTGWSDGYSSLKSLSRTIVATDETAVSARDLAATFEPRQYTLILVAPKNATTQEQVGYVNYDRTQWKDSICIGNLRFDNQIYIAAQAIDNHEFSFWSDGVTDAQRTISVGSFFGNQDTIRLLAHFDAEPRKVTVTTACSECSNVAAAGSARIEHGASYGLVENGTNVTIVATPNPGYEFLGWTEIKDDGSENEVAGPDEANFTFLVKDYDRTLRANFQPRRFELMYTVSPAESGTVTVTRSANAQTYGPDGTILISDVIVGDQFKAVAKPASAGYSFEKWTNYNGETVHLDLTHYTSVNKDQIINGFDGDTLIAVFKPAVHRIVASYDPNMGSAVVKQGAAEDDTLFVNYGSKDVKLIATPINDCYEFVQWEDGSVEPFRSVSLIDRDSVFEATFQRKNFTVNVNATEGGNVNGQTSISSSFNCGDNTPIVLTATADEGYHFVRWSNETQAPERDYRDVTNTIELLPTENMDITAEFALNTYKVSVVANPSSLGSVTPAVSEQIYTYDPQAGYPTLEISAKPNAGVDFNGWSNGVTTASQVVTIMSDTTFEASFGNIDYTISLAADPSNLGQVEASAATAHYGDVVDISATPFPGARFIAWSDGVAEPSRHLTITQNVSLTASFEAIGYLINVTAEPQEAGSIEASAVSALYGESVTVRATAQPGYHFARWSTEPVSAADNRGNDMTSIDTTFVVKGDVEFKAIFAKNTYTVTFVPDQHSSFLSPVKLTDKYLFGDEIKVVVIPTTGYHVSAWSDNTELRDSLRTITVTGNATYSVTTASNDYRIIVTASPSEAASSLTAVTGLGEAHNGVATGWAARNEQVTLIPVVALPFEFSAWSDGSQDQKKTIIVVQSDVNLGVILRQATFAVNVDMTGVDEYGTVTVQDPNKRNVNGKEVPASTEITLTATPKTAPDGTPITRFVAWVDQNTGENLSTEPVYTFNVVGPVNIKPKFEYVLYTLSLSVDDAVKGRIDASNNKKNFTGGSYRYGDVVTFSAVSKNSKKYSFNQWSDGVADAHREITVTGDMTLQAQFSDIYYSLNVVVTPEGTADVSYDKDKVLYGETITVTVTPHYNHYIAGWNKSGSNPNVKTRTFTMTKDYGTQTVYINDVEKRVFGSDGQLLHVEGASENAIYKVYNFNGDLIYKGTMDLLHLPKGAYIIKVEDREFKVLVR
jgi:hypothetical protein